jgi:NADH-quinone oxidoreductase subunit D
MSVELTVCGDEVVEGKTHVGYLHRGFEKLMERRTFIQCFPIVCRICVPEPDFNEYCYAAAVEELAGIEVPEKANWIRTLILEMGRINSYLMYLGGQAGAFGQGVIGQWTTYVRDLMLDRFEELTGARIYHMFIMPGGVRDDLPDGFDAAHGRDPAGDREHAGERRDDVMFHNAVFKKRAVGLGYVDPPGSTNTASPARSPAPPASPRTCARPALPGLSGAGLRAGHRPGLRRLRPRRRAPPRPADVGRPDPPDPRARCPARAR